MEMAEVTAPLIYEELAGAGIDRDRAYRIERAITAKIDQSQSKTEKEIFAHVMTKEDGLLMKQEIINEVNGRIDKIDQKIDRNLLWTIGTMIAIAGILFGAIKLLH